MAFTRELWALQQACAAYLKQTRLAFTSKAPGKLHGKTVWPRRGKTYVRYPECASGPDKIDRRDARKLPVAAADVVSTA